MSLLRIRTITLLVPLALGPLAGCAAKVEAKVAREEAKSVGLSYTMQIDSTRLRRGSGLSSVASVADLLEDGLSRFFRVRPRADGHGEPGSSFREIIAESPAPGFGVRATVEERPDDFVLVTIEGVTLTAEGRPVITATAPYSVHFGISAVRAAMASLRQVAWPVMDPETFDVLRTQATALGAAGDPAIDESTFAHAPRPLQRADDPPRYYAPPMDESTLRGK